MIKDYYKPFSARTLNKKLVNQALELCYSVSAEGQQQDTACY